MLTTKRNDALRVASQNFLNNPNDFDKRLDSLVNSLKKVNPEVIAFQEIMEHLRTPFEEALKSLGYKYFYCCVVECPDPCGQG